MRTSQKINGKYCVIYTFEVEPRINPELTKWNEFCESNGAIWQSPLSYAQLYKDRPVESLTYNERIESQQQGNAIIHGWKFSKELEKTLRSEISAMTMEYFGVDYN
jgi:hypothetical protein